MFILSLHNRPWCHLYNFTNPKCDDEASEQELLVKLWFWGHLLAFVSGKIVPWEKLPWPTEDNFIPSICLSTSHASHLSEIHSYQLSFAAMRDWQKLSDKSLSSCNTELRFQSSTMWHNYVITKPQLDNQSKKEKNMRAWRRLKENEPASIYNIVNTSLLACVSCIPHRNTLTL